MTESSPVVENPGFYPPVTSHVGFPKDYYNVSYVSTWQWKVRKDFGVENVIGFYRKVSRD